MEAQSNTSKFAELIKKYKKLLIIVLVFVTIICLSYFLSESYRVSNCLKRIKLYQKYIKLESDLKINKIRKLKLADFYIASSYKSCCGVNKTFDYLSLDILQGIIKSGARVLWFDVFNETFEESTKPIVTNGYQEGEWKLNFNYVYFEECCKLISEIAFSSGEIDNYHDPLFIALNLNVNRNLNTLNEMSDILYKYFSKKLLGSKYSKNQVNLALEPVENFLGKVVIMSSKGYEDSKLEELVNTTWDTENFRKIDNLTIDKDVDESTVVKLDINELRDYNSGNLSMVLNQDGLSSSNYNPKYGFNTGCQFIFMNYQTVDRHMDRYMSNFMTSSFIAKPEKYRRKTTFGDSMSISQNKAIKKLKKINKGPACPEKPKENVEIIDLDALNSEKPIVYKNKTSNIGLCAFSTKCPIKYNDENKSLWKQLKSGISLVMSDKDRTDTQFDFGCVNDRAGNSPDGSQFYNWKPKICCSTDEKNDLKDLYTLSPNCFNPETYKGTVGIKIDNTYSNVVPFDKGSQDGNYTWAYPKICKINNLEQVKKGKNCLISTQKCPEGWNNKDGEDILLENNWKLCCKNL
jgi:hypothetical protein